MSKYILYEDAFRYLTAKYQESAVTVNYWLTKELPSTLNPYESSIESSSADLTHWADSTLFPRFYKEDDLRSFKFKDTLLLVDYFENDRWKAIPWQELVKILTFFHSLGKFTPLHYKTYEAVGMDNFEGHLFGRRYTEGSDFSANLINLLNNLYVEFRSRPYEYVGWRDNRYLKEVTEATDILKSKYSNRVLSDNTVCFFQNQIKEIEKAHFMDGSDVSFEGEQKERKKSKKHSCPFWDSLINR